MALSSGDEGGVQGGGVVTHKFKGKATFVLWSFTVKVEGKGVCRNGDQMQQNEASEPGNIISRAAFVDIHPLLERPDEAEAEKGIARQRTRIRRTRRPTRTSATAPASRIGERLLELSGKGQRRRLQERKPYSKGQRWVADHQPPQSVVWRLLGGCHDDKVFNEWKKSNEAVIPQCTGCSNAQGSYLSQNDGSAVLEAMGIPF